jgi:acetylornithine deacetylase
MTVTSTAGKQHNVVPAECHLVVDIRVNDCYNNQEILDTVRKHLTAEINPRSMHLNASSIPVAHGGQFALGRTTARLPFRINRF